jgi:hypothetical protein
VRTLTEANPVGPRAGPLGRSLLLTLNTRPSATPQSGVRIPLGVEGRVTASAAGPRLRPYRGTVLLLDDCPIVLHPKSCFITERRLTNASEKVL